MGNASSDCPQMPKLMLSTSMPHHAQMRTQRRIWSIDMSVLKNTGVATVPPLPAAPRALLTTAAAVLAVPLPCHA